MQCQTSRCCDGLFIGKMKQHPLAPIGSPSLFAMLTISFFTPPSGIAYTSLQPPTLTIHISFSSANSISICTSF